MPKTYKYKKSFTHNGKRYWVYADTKIQLGRNLLAKQQALDTQEYEESNIRLKDWAILCIDTYKVNQKDITRRKYMSRVNHCIIQHLGDKPIKKIRPIDCQSVLNLQHGNSKAQINSVYQALRFIFKYAVAEGLIIKDPTTHLTKPIGTYTPRRALTSKERDCILAVAKKDRRYYYYLLMLLCGCRPSEAAECQGKDIKIIDGFAMLEIRGTKTHNAVRFVPIPEELYMLVKDTPPFEFIAQSKSGNKITNFSRLWRYFKRDLNLFMGAKTYRNKIIGIEPVAKDLFPYCLRHEYCTNLARKGIDIRVAQKLMGHGDISLTANIYTHVDIDIIKIASESLSGYSEGTTQGTTPKRVKKG